MKDHSLSVEQIEEETVADLPPRRFSADASRRMYCVDTTDNPRIPVLMELVGAVSRANTPQEIYRRFRDGIVQLSGPIGYIALSIRGLEPGEYKITRLELPHHPYPGEHNPWANWDHLETYQGGFLGELIRSAWPELIHNLEIDDDPVLHNLLAGFRSMMAIPIFDDGEPLNWSIFLGVEPEQFSIVELEEAILRVNLVGGMTKTTLISQQLRQAQERIRKEVTQIASIQRSLLPDPLPQIEGTRLAASYVTSEEAGGDYYDFFPLDRREEGEADRGGRWGVVIADASGHGPAAAVVMAMLHAILHATTDPRNGPSSVLETANRHLCAKRIEGSFVTAFYGIYDAKARTLTYARAGHNPPILKERETTTRLDHVGGIPLGIDPGHRLSEHTIQLEPGQTIMFYTDGVTEALDDRRRLFGIEGIERALHDCTGEADCTIASINAALAEHQKRSSVRDDQTLVALEVTG